MSQSIRATRLGRRSFLVRAAGALGGAFGALSVRDALAQSGNGRPARAALGNGGYGELQPVTRFEPDFGGEVNLFLPEGFDFVAFGTVGRIMADGNITPLALDGMAAFPGLPGMVRLVRNHEERTGSASVLASGSPDKRYDFFGGGGTSTLEIAFDGAGIPFLQRDWMSISGTIVNCAGGATPSGSWLTCEETTVGMTSGWEQPHGYIFEVPSASEEEVDAVPLTAMGRFVHEAVCVDPRTGIVYETEDRGTGGIYRFIPNIPGNLAEGGRLQMLAIKHAFQYDTRTGQTTARGLPVSWVDIPDPNPPEAEADSLAVFRQGLEQGGAIFGRPEGCWFGNGAVYFCCTNGGDAGEGQIWEYKPAGRSEGVLRLIYESPGVEALSFPDNITVTPSGALLLCEDTGRRDFHYLQGLTRDGRIFPFCATTQGGEWAGATFSPDGNYLFVNLFGSSRGNPTDPTTFSERGTSLAIWGPWEIGAL